jgi:uncharacterized repeat protein (TIGR03803 family)
MKPAALSRFACGICTAVLLAGCGGSPAPIGAPGTTAQAIAKLRLQSTIPPLSHRSDYSVLYRFAGPESGPAAAIPLAGLAELNGVLYGTTYSGGTNGYGTVFSLSKSGTESVLHSFNVHGDGVNPSASLIAVRGILYGTTRGGGGAGLGTVLRSIPLARKVYCTASKAALTVKLRIRG